VFERFTERARQVVVFAQDEARQLRHNYIGTEHLLLGLLRDPESVAGEVLSSLEVRLEDVRGQVARIVGLGDEATVGQIPFTPRGKKVLELSLREALSVEHNYIGPEHILLGLAREDEGVAARILLDFGADANTIRSAVGKALGVDSSTRPPGPVRVPRGWSEFDLPLGGPSSSRVTLGVSRSPGVNGHSPWQARPLLLGWLLFGAALGIGILIGWLIWG
jgi:ClpA/ClpB-like protein